MSKRRKVNEGMMNAWQKQSYKEYIKEELAKNPEKYASCATADEVTALLSRDLGGRICDTRADRSAFGEALEDLEYFEPTLFDPASIAAGDNMVTESIANLGKPEGETSVFYGEEAIDMLLQDEKDTTFYYIPLSEPRPAVAIKSERRTRVSSWQFEDDEIELEVGIPRGPAICMTAIPASQLKIVCHDFEGYYTIYKDNKPLCYLRASMNNRDFRPVSWDYGKDYEEPTYVDEWNDYLGYEDEETPVNESITNLGKREHETSEFHGQDAADLLLQDQDWISCVFVPEDEDPAESYSNEETEIRRWNIGSKPAILVGVVGEYAMNMVDIPLSALKVVYHDFDGYYSIYNDETFVANVIIYGKAPYNPMKWDGEMPESDWND